MCVLFDSARFDVLSAHTLVYSSMFRGYGMHEYHQIPHSPGAPFTYSVPQGKSVGHGLAPWFRDIVLHPKVLKRAGLTTDAKEPVLISWVDSFLKPSSRAQVRCCQLSAWVGSL